MRVIHSYDPGSVALQPILPSGHYKKETVIVVSAVPAEKTENAYTLGISEEGRARDREVRTHEQTHLALLGGAAASPVMYDTIRGSNGETIAVGGRIKVDLSEVPGDPEATLRKARAVITAANAPRNPSAGDQRTAALAYNLERKARAELDAVNLVDLQA